MLAQILTKTPHWVWFLLAGLIVLGLLQTVTRVVKLRRVIIIPVVMTGLSVAGAVSAFGDQALLGWLPAVLLTVLITLRTVVPAPSSFNPVARSLTVPGSWVPLGLFLGIFMTKFVVGMVGAVQPQWLHDAAFTLGFSALYGVFSGVFVGRAIALLKGAGVWASEVAQAGKRIEENARPA